MSVAAFAPISHSILVLIVVAGLNFLRLFNFFFKRRARSCRRREVRLYVALPLVAALLRSSVMNDGSSTARTRCAAALFQATSIMTTTGFATADYTLWGRSDDHAAAADVRRRLGRIDRRRDQGRAPSAVFRIVRRDLEQAVHPSHRTGPQGRELVDDGPFARRSSSCFCTFRVRRRLRSSLRRIGAARSGAQLTPSSLRRRRRVAR